MLTRGVLVLFFLTSVASAQLVQTTQSETQLASVLCRNPTKETNDLLLETKAQLVNVTLWNALLDCASSEHRQGSLAKSIEIYKLTLRVTDRLKKPDLAAITYYHLGRTYSAMSAVENSIQAYETSRKLFEQAGNENGVIYVLADLGAMYVTLEDYERHRVTQSRVWRSPAKRKGVPGKNP
jgi:tetratricopeptide (TPR) repeat protein